jgi:opacity protein-like surface antigen
MRSPLLFAAALLATAALAAPASADALEYSAGVKLSAGGDYWSKPSGVPMKPNGQPDDELGFKGDGGGFAYGAGAYLEIRALKFLGLELGLGYDVAKVQRKVTYNGVFDTHEQFTANSVRVPILAKFILPLGIARLSAGIGPDFLVPLSAEASVSADNGTPLNVQDTSGAIGPVIALAHKKSSMLLTGELGLTIEIPAIGIDIPIALRASKNMSQPDAWLERVPPTSTLGTYVVYAQPSIDARLVAGVGYRF